MKLPKYLENEQVAERIGRLLSGKDPIFPAREDMRKIGPINSLREFKELGLQSFKVLLNYTNITPSSAVLDIGCGYGRLAIPLTRYLDPAAGSYEGFDVMPDAITDCRQRITTRYPNFGFSHLDVHNGLYNHGSDAEVGDSRFQYREDQFDLVFMFSVFSHMKPADVASYLAEIHRVLKPGGMLMTTFFLINDHARTAIDNGNTRRTFRHTCDGFLADDAQSPESAVAYDEESVQDMVAGSGLHHIHTFHGQWANRRWALSGQDAVICVKPLSDNR